MTHTESSSSIPERQHANGKVGEPLPIKLKGESHVPPPGPGSMQMDKYDPEYLAVLTCGWYPAGELSHDSADFRVIFTPLKAGVTEVNFLVRPRAINPLYQPVVFIVTIEA